ncbi:hypothetical protein niasHS_011611 [Heterodera schachtii]|uniref:Uncharacterized protein n=1 Tax=Heterodera schachtii TaxID=97005 RepID=A0ABD2IWU5_HETSC
MVMAKKYKMEKCGKIKGPEWHAGKEGTRASAFQKHNGTGREGTRAKARTGSSEGRCNAWRQIGRGRPSITNRSGNDDNTSGSNSETAAVTTVSANSGHSDDRAGARDSDGQRLDSFCKVIGAWERTECRSRNTRCEAVEVSLRGWEWAGRPDTLFSKEKFKEKCK